MKNDIKKRNIPNKKKLLNSKWTAIKPENKEKHFNVTKVILSEDDEQVVFYIILTAILTSKDYKIFYRDLENEDKWMQGWF